jgi:phosphate/sulfate permease
MTVLIALLAFGITVILHAVVCRLPIGLSVVLKLVMVGGAVGFGLAAVLALLFGLSISTLAGVVTYALACELYIFFFTLILSSVSAIWLRRLYRGSIESDALAEAYSPAWMVDTRLERLAENGFLDRTSDGYRLTEKGLSLMRTFERLRRIFNHAPREA